ncbi:MAG: thiol-disulfide oxidoreductase DCC family protein [Bacteroidota bacterium]
MQYSANTHPMEDRVILFDGVCNLCNSSVNFVIDRDRAGLYKFSALQSAEAKAYLAKAGLNGEVDDELLQSVVLYENGVLYKKSTAALRIARQLDGPWPLLYAFVIAPRFIRDAVYDVIARNRYFWFGQRDACRLPTPELRQRFLDGLTPEPVSPS